MNNRELDNLLKSATFPEPTAEFWEQFPGDVIAEANRRSRQAEQRPVVAVPTRRLTSAAILWRGALAVGVALVCVGIGFGLGLLRGHRLGSEEAQLLLAQKYFREIQVMFPNQIEAIEFDAKGARLKLAEHADVPASPPLYVSICGPHGCQRFVTFSGQQIRVNGQVLDVLQNRQGEVLVVGKQWIWPDPNGEKNAPYRVEARLLPIAS